MRQRSETGRDGRSGPTAGAAGHALRIPGRADGIAEQVLGDSDQAELRRVGLAQEHGAGRLQALVGDAAGVGDVVFEDLGALRRADTGNIVQVLDGDGHPEQRRQRIEVAPRSRIDVARRRSGGLAAGDINGDGEEGVQDRVEPVDALQHLVDDVAG